MLIDEINLFNLRVSNFPRMYKKELVKEKITDSLYKKDIGKFLETLSSHFI